MWKKPLCASWQSRIKRNRFFFSVSAPQCFPYISTQKSNKKKMSTNATRNNNNKMDKQEWKMETMSSAFEHKLQISLHREETKPFRKISSGRTKRPAREWRQQQQKKPIHTTEQTNTWAQQVSEQASNVNACHFAWRMTSFTETNWSAEGSKQLCVKSRTTNGNIPSISGTIFVQM